MRWTKTSVRKVISAALTCTSSAAWPADIDALAFINQKLSAKPNILYVKSGTKTEVRCEPKPPIIARIECSASQTPYTYQEFGAPVVTQTRIVEVKNIRFEKGRMTSLPRNGLLAIKKIENCGDASVTATVSLSISGTSSWGVTKTAGVSTTTGGSARLQFGTKELGGDIQFKWDQTISTSEQKQESHSETVTRTTTDQIQVAQRKAVRVKLLAYESGFEIPFTASILIDGDIPSNLSKVTKASDFLKPQELTVPFKGSLKMLAVSEGNTRTENLTGAEGCPPNAKTVIETASDAQRIPEATLRDLQKTPVGVKMAGGQVSAKGLGLQVFPAMAAVGSSSCSASNDNGGTCSISCPEGQSAQCQDTSGSTPPICECR